MKEKKLGLIEGYYGTPWPAAVREMILNRAAGWGYNCYIYGPKDDPYHRDRWREPYPEAVFESIVALAELLERLNMDFTLSLSPGLDLQYSGDKDFSLLTDKINRFYDRGIRSFGIFFDDIPPFLASQSDLGRFHSLADAQNSYLMRVYDYLKRRDPAIELLTCPTEYHGNGDSEYIRAFCRDLPAELAVFWTGREVCSHSLSTPDTLYFQEKTGHAPLYWDNFPVNDSVMLNELHLGPYENRDNDILDHCDGILLNVMDRPYLSQIALMTAADFFKEGRKYQAEASWQKALKSLIEPEILDAFRSFARFNFRSCINPYFSNPSLMKDFMAGMNIPDWNCGKALKEVARKGRAAVSVLLSHQSDPYIAEALPWIEQYKNLMDLFSLYEKRRESCQEYMEALIKFRLNNHVIFQMESLSTIDRDYYL